MLVKCISSQEGQYTVCIFFSINDYKIILAIFVLHFGIFKIKHGQLNKISIEY